MTAYLHSTVQHHLIFTQAEPPRKSLQAPYTWQITNRHRSLGEWPAWRRWGGRLDDPAGALRRQNGRMIEHLGSYVRSQLEPPLVLCPIWGAGPPRWSACQPVEGNSYRPFYISVVCSQVILRHLRLCHLRAQWKTSWTAVPANRRGISRAKMVRICAWRRNRKC